MKTEYKRQRFKEYELVYVHEFTKLLFPIRNKKMSKLIVLLLTNLLSLDLMLDTGSSKSREPNKANILTRKIELKTKGP